MDINSLAVIHGHAQLRSAQMNARAEDRYYATQIALLPLRPGLLGAIAMMAGVFLFLGTSLI
nr:hypothetical protein [uncultured Devosia sp.]